MDELLDFFILANNRWIISLVYCFMTALNEDWHKEDWKKESIFGGHLLRENECQWKRKEREVKPGVGQESSVT